MQPHQRHLLPLSLLSLIAAGQMLHAQSITVTVADVQAQLAPGMTLTNHNDSLTTQVNIGRKGASSWDFSALRHATWRAALFVPRWIFSGSTEPLQSGLSPSVPVQLHRVKSHAIGASKGL